VAEICGGVLRTPTRNESRNAKCIRRMSEQRLPIYFTIITINYNTLNPLTPPWVLTNLWAIHPRRLGLARPSGELSIIGNLDYTWSGMPLCQTRT